jgi:hypothetical protein
MEALALKFDGMQASTEFKNYLIDDILNNKLPHHLIKI